jgi:hypothetical protein
MREEVIMAKGKDVDIPSVKGGSKSGEKATTGKDGKLTPKGNYGSITGKR